MSRSEQPVAREYDPKALKFEWQRRILACRLGDKTTAVALALSIHANKDGTNAHPGERLLAHETEVSERTVRRALERLRELGLLRRTLRGSRAKGRNWADRYDLAIPDDLEDRVEVEAKPSPNPSHGKGRGGRANHVRWHERRDLIDPKCIHCADPLDAFTNPSGGPHEALTEDSVSGPKSIRPPVTRISDHRPDGPDHRSVQDDHHAFTPVLKDEHNPATSVAAARASSRGPKTPSFEAFYRRTWPDHVSPGEVLSEQDEDYVYDMIEREYIESVLGDLDAIEESTVNGMLSNAAHPKMIVNKILDMRGAVA